METLTWLLVWVIGAMILGLYIFLVFKVFTDKKFRKELDEGLKELDKHRSL